MNFCLTKSEGKENTMTPLSDELNYRAMTVEQADQLFRGIALLTIGLNRMKSEYEKRIADLKSAAERETAPLEEELKDKTAVLNAYIRANPERFRKPRQHLTGYGKYGFRTVSRLEIRDEDAVKAAVKQLNIPALLVIERLDKKTLEKALAEGREIPGCAFLREESVCLTVAKALPDD